MEPVELPVRKEWIEEQRSLLTKACLPLSFLDLQKAVHEALDSIALALGGWFDELTLKRQLTLAQRVTWIQNLGTQLETLFCESNSSLNRENNANHIVFSLKPRIEKIDRFFSFFFPTIGLQGILNIDIHYTQDLHAKWQMPQPFLRRVGVAHIVERVSKLMQTAGVLLEELTFKQLCSFNKNYNYRIFTYDLSRYQLDTKMIRLLLVKKTAADHFEQFISFQKQQQELTYIASFVASEMQTHLMQFCSILKGDEIERTFHHLGIQAKGKPNTYWDPHNKVATGYPWSIYHHLHAHIVFVLRQTPLTQQSHILELCAGEGELAASILETMPCHYTIVDNNALSLATAQKSLDAYKDRYTCLNMHVVYGSYANFQPPNIVIISGGTTYHVLNTKHEARRVLKKIYACLAVDGILILTGRAPQRLKSKDLTPYFHLKNAVELDRFYSFYILQKRFLPTVPILQEGKLDMWSLFYCQKEKEKRLTFFATVALEQIEELDFSDIEDLSIEEVTHYIDRCPGLKVLKLCGMRSIKKCLAAIQWNQRRIHILDLSSTPVTLSQAEKIAEHASIQDIILDECLQISLKEQILLRVKLALKVNPQAPSLHFLASSHYCITELLEDIFGHLLNEGILDHIIKLDVSYLPLSLSLRTQLRMYIKEVVFSPSSYLFNR